MEIGIIVQARMGSTRFPGKVLTKIYKNNTLLDVIIQNLKKLNQKIIIATTNNYKDEEIVKVVKKHNLDYFRGDEQNVLKRFIDCAKKFKIKNIIRICADNCFIQNEFISSYLYKFNLRYDYISYRVSNINGILTHWGLFGEFVSLKALKIVQKRTNKKEYLEHVTNYVYTHPNQFKIKYIEAPEELLRDDIRLTIDTVEDLKICKNIVKYLTDNNIEWKYQKIIDYIENNQDLLEIMRENIKKNKKF